MNQVKVLCQNENCVGQIINRVCLNKNCNKNKLICERCFISHKNHLEDCFLTYDIPKKINEIQEQKENAQAATEKAIECFLKKVRMQIEQKFSFQLCPIYQIEVTPNIENWTQTNFYQFSQKVSLLDFNSQYFDQALSEKINQLNSIQFDAKSYQQLFVPNLQQQTRKKIITQGLSAKAKNYGMTNFLPQILRENVYQSIEIKGDELISGSDMEKLSILTPNLLDLAQDQIKLVFQYEGDIFYLDGINKFGLYTGTLTHCTLSEDHNEGDLILINDQAKYVQSDLQLLKQEELQQLFLENDKNQLMLVFNKEKNNQSLSLTNLRSNQTVQIQLNTQFLQVYFCFSLSCQAKIKII